MNTTWLYVKMGLKTLFAGIRLQSPLQLAEKLLNLQVDNRIMN